MSLWKAPVVVRDGFSSSSGLSDFMVRPLVLSPFAAAEFPGLKRDRVSQSIVGRCHDHLADEWTSLCGKVSLLLRQAILRTGSMRPYATSLEVSPVLMALIVAKACR